MITSTSTDLTTRSPDLRTVAPEHTWVPAPFRVAFPFCDRDADQAVKFFKLCAFIQNEKNPNELILITDHQRNEEKSLAVLEAAKDAFKIVNELRLPMAPKVKWPHCNNRVFRFWCEVESELDNKPWLWLETDCCPSKSDWLQRIEREYDAGGRPFGGNVVDSYAILNGVAVYPHNLKAWCPKVWKKQTGQWLAFDVEIAPEIYWFIHPMNHVISNVWMTRENGQPGLVPGVVPIWTQQLFDFTDVHSMALLHRCKDDTLFKMVAKKLKGTEKYT